MTNVNVITNNSLHLEKKIHSTTKIHQAVPGLIEIVAFLEIEKMDYDLKYLSNLQALQNK